MIKAAKVLVVGGAGFVGSNLCNSLISANNKVTVVDNLLSADISNVPNHPNLSFVFGSISDDRILANLPTDYDYVFHLATYHGNQSSIADPISDHYNNTLTTLKLCEHFKDAKNLKKFVYASAGCTVAQKTFDKAEATNEDAPVSLYLDSPYQISKIVGEFYGNYYLMRYKLPFVKARFQNVYGPREILGAGLWRGTKATVWRNVTPTFIWKSLNKESLPVENGGIATRDFIYVDDLVNGLIACATKGESGGVYNLASGVETSIAELAETINKLTGNNSDIANADKRPWDRSGKRFGDPLKAKDELGFKCVVNLSDGLERTVKWFKENNELIQGSILKHKFFMPELSSYQAKK